MRLFDIKAVTGWKFSLSDNTKNSSGKNLPYWYSHIWNKWARITGVFNTYAQLMANRGFAITGSNQRQYRLR